MPDGELLTAGYVLVVYVCKFCINSLSRLEYNFQFVGPGVRMAWTVIKNFGRKLMHEVSDGFDIKGVVQMADESTPRTVTDHS
jgi:hypothetical protein